TIPAVAVARGKASSGYDDATDSVSLGPSPWRPSPAPRALQIYTKSRSIRSSRGDQNPRLPQRSSLVRHRSCSDLARSPAAKLRFPADDLSIVVNLDIVVEAISICTRALQPGHSDF